LVSKASGKTTRLYFQVRPLVLMMIAKAGSCYSATREPPTQALGGINNRKEGRM
jgi:hypothetical protein